MAGSGWNIIEDDDFELAVQKCGGPQKVDEAIAPILHGLNRCPTGFHPTQTPGIWIARTKLRLNGPEIIMSHCVWFRVDEPKREVILLWVEETRPRDMDWDDDWEITF